MGFAEVTTEKLIDKAISLKLETQWPELGRILRVLHNRLRVKEFIHVRCRCELSERTAYYLMSIVRRTDGRGINLEEGLPWRKVAVIAALLNNLVTDEECITLLRQVPEMTHEQLAAIVRKK